ncbi:UDP-N-acetylmuramate--L-alanine ligase [Auraticoccus monumenti]|uniref:UDP-N-acetylmuramate--L-alanine ligase n=1 Tax=Auraticoccus monumenti TaxID=675864 RepID=A0A1G7DM49_9ACTN|nr:UDP-N-acetylmuramate--L-alanine ligase [Auraticoccus monumenti]SDE52572.1 UDP-N-acetylmuramate--L-alanine ligase [Auraticoccus monumenti]
MTLHEPVELVPVTELGDVHLIAVGGAGMSGVAALYADLGVRVSGSDRADSPVLQQLADRGVRVHVGHAAEQLGGADTVVVSSAIAVDNPELVEARRRGLRVWHRSAALGALVLGRRGIAVAGTAGKTTTSAMLATTLVHAGLDPSYVVGAPLQQTGTSAALGAGEHLVIEADESDGSFLQYPAEVVVVTNVEADHLDNWGTEEAYRDGFRRFVTAPGVQAVVLCADDPGAAALADRVSELGDDGPELVLYGESPLADLVLSDVVVDARSTRAHLVWRGNEEGELVVAAPGHHNALDAAAVYAVARLLGVDSATALAGLAAFAGTSRRFERVAEVGGVLVVDDYAHHPTKVRAALAAGRAAAGPGRLLVCFQPHLFTRTRDFADDFGAALALADELVLLDIYPAREEPIPGVTTALVEQASARRLGAEHVHWVPRAEVAATLAALARPGDLVMTVGAGDVTTVARELAAVLAGGEDAG